MGLINKSRVKEEPATPVPVRKPGDLDKVAGRVAARESSAKPPTASQWKRIKKQEKKMDLKNYESKKLERSNRMDSLLAQSSYHKQGHRPALESQQAYSPNGSRSNSLLKEATKVGWATASIAATKTFFGFSKR